MREGLGRAAAIAVTAVLVAQAAAAQQPSPVVVDEVRHEPLSQTQPVLGGRFVARQSGEVAARTAGPVTEMRIEIGDRVEAGDIMAVLDLDRLKLQRDLAASTEREMAALLDSAKAQLAKRRQDLEAWRRSGVGVRGVPVPAPRYDNAVQDAAVSESTVAAAAAALARARASLRIARDELADGEVTAPYNGVVTARHTEVGAWVGVGAPVATLLNENDLEIEADVPYNRISGLSPGAPVTISLADGSPHRAVVRAVGAEENALTHTRRVRFTPEVTDIAGRQRGWRVGVGQPAARGAAAGAHGSQGRDPQTPGVVAGLCRERRGRGGNPPRRPRRGGRPRFEALDGVAVGERVVIRATSACGPDRR